jgi:hypothetical protein
MHSLSNYYGSAWFQKSDHRLNRYEEMLQAFQAMFQEQHSSWVPYLFVYVGNAICNTTAEQERAFITFLKSMEQYLIEKEYIQAVDSAMLGMSKDRC